MKKLPILLVLAAALAVAGCDNNIPPTNATGVDQTLRSLPCSSRQQALNRPQRRNYDEGRVGGKEAGAAWEVA